jgi:hypothetical protein
MEHTPRAVADFETRSACSSRRTGSWRYSLDPTTEPLCMAFRLPYWEEGRTGLWHPAFPQVGLKASDGDDDLQELFWWILGGGIVEAHNSFFERGIWTNIMTPRYGWPAIPHRSWRCSAAKAATYALPRALDAAGAALNLSVLKDDEGSKVMKKLMKPRKPRKKEREDWQKKYGDRPMPLLYHESADLFHILFRYCRQDVLAEEAVSSALDDLTPMETEVFLLNEEMNERGFQLDMRAVDRALTVIEEDTTRLNAELCELTGGSPSKATQRTKMLEWFESKGLKLYDTQKGTIQEAIDSDEAFDESAVDEDDELPPWVEPQTALAPDVRRGLEILQQLGLSSTAKFVKMREWACPADGRARGGILYHGATTGRFSGAGIQPHNFPKGFLKEEKHPMTAIWVDILTLEKAQVEAKYGCSMLKLLSHALRGAITARNGRHLFVADYASIEVRVLLWLAEDEAHLDMLRKGVDMYVDMASKIYNKRLTKEDKTERGLGKAVILGCFAADTLVLTDSGWLPIINVTPRHKVWDGESWVSHDGCIYQGVKETICVDGLHVTPDHLIQADNQWFRADQVARDEGIKSRVLATALVNLPCADIRWESGAASKPLSWSARVGQGCMRYLRTICERVSQRGAIAAHEPNPASPERNTLATRISSLMTRIANACSTASARFSPVAKTLATETMRGMGGAASVFTPTGDLTADAGFSWPTWSVSPDGTTPPWTSIGSTTIVATNPPTYVSSPKPSTLETSDRCPFSPSASESWKPVYDLVNAGPRQRFMVKTASGVLLVHNCGYQMGASKFVDTAATYGITIDETFSKTVVDTYRAEYWRVKSLWYDCEEAAIAAVENPGEPQSAGRVIYVVEDSRFLFCYLPSGRRLAYPFPEIQERRTPWGAVKNALTYMGVDQYTRKWRRQVSYGGMLVENAVQAVARDLMAQALLNVAHTRVYEPVLSIHDEVVCEAHPLLGDLREFERLLTQVPEWAEGCPIAVESWNGPRYRKG